MQKVNVYVLDTLDHPSSINPFNDPIFNVKYIKVENRKDWLKQLINYAYSDNQDNDVLILGTSNFHHRFDLEHLKRVLWSIKQHNNRYDAVYLGTFGNPSNIKHFVQLSEDYQLVDATAQPFALLLHPSVVTELSYNFRNQEDAKINTKVLIPSLFSLDVEPIIQNQNNQHQHNNHNHNQSIQNAQINVKDLIPQVNQQSRQVVQNGNQPLIYGLLIGIGVIILLVFLYFILKKKR